MAFSQQQKSAMRRLKSDLEEIQKSPVANVSASPLDKNFFEWHCNFSYEGIIYHLILFFPDNYPYVSPSAEFVPSGFQYSSGATRTGKKGTQICLSIFSDFANFHQEWADEKSMGWSPGYTVQTVLLNVVAFLSETQCSGSEASNEHNKKLSQGFHCDDCGHTFKKPFPPISDVQQKGEMAGGKQQIVCYVSKEHFKPTKPKSREDLFGYGLVVSGPPNRPAFTSPCEFLTGESFYGMQSSIGTVKSVFKDDLKFFLPMFIHPNHGKEIKSTFEDTLMGIAKIMPKCNPKKTPIEEMVIKVLPNLMSATVVEFSKGTQHTSDNHLNGYFAFHRLLLWAMEAYPELDGIVNNRLKNFFENEENRMKKQCPHIGELLMLLSASFKYRWQDMANGYLSESMRRNVMWYVKEDSKLGFLDTEKEYRLSETLTRTAISRKLLAFQVLFLDIAMPKGKSRANLIRQYDNHLGFPTSEMVQEMKAACEKINGMTTFKDWFEVLKLKPLTDDELFDRFVSSVEFSIKTDGYHWSFPKTAGGWREVMWHYKDMTKKNASGKDKVVNKKGTEPQPSPSTKQTVKKNDKAAPVIRGRGRGRQRGRGRGVNKVQVVVDDDDDVVEIVPKKGRPVKEKRGQGRGKRAASEALESSKRKASKRQ